MCDYVADFEVGQPIATMAGGCFSDYVVLPLKFVMPVATMQKEVVALLTSGLTASIGQSLYTTSSALSSKFAACMSKTLIDNSISMWFVDSGSRLPG